MSEWKNYRLKDLFCIYSGATPSSKIEEYWDGDIKWVTPADMSDFGYISNCANTITQVGYDSCGTTLVPADSIIISSRAPIGKINITKSPMCTNQGCKSLVPQKNNVNSKFVAYYLYNNVKDIDSLGQGTTFKELPTKRLIPYSIMMPSYIEQQRIVDYLDKKLATIDQRVEVLEKEKGAYARLKKSVINQAVTRGLNPNVPLKDSGIDWIGMIPEHWEVKRFKDISELNPQYEGDNLDCAVSFLPMEGLRNDNIDLKEIKFGEGKGKYTYFGNDDLLVAKVTPCFENGNIAIASNLKEGIGFGSSEIFVLRMKEDVSVRYFFYYVQTSNFQDEACSTMCGVGGLKRISPIFMRTRVVPTPPLSEQQAIADYLDEKCAKIDAAIENISKQIDASKRLKKAIINEAISGKLFD